MPSAIWEIFSEFLIFCDLFHEPLGQWNISKIWEISKIFVNIAQDYCAATSLLLALKLDRAILFLRHFTILLPFTSILCKNRSYLPCHTQELNILNKNMLKLKIYSLCYVSSSFLYSFMNFCTLWYYNLLRQWYIFS